MFDALPAPPENGSVMALLADVTWVHVQKPTFDLVGLIVGSLELTGIFALVAFSVGALLGLSFILRSRARPYRLPGEDVSILHEELGPSA
jgi:hypothetical protein